MLRQTCRLLKVNHSVTNCNRNLICGGVYGIIHKAMSIDCYDGHTGGGDFCDSHRCYKTLE